MSHKPLSAIKRSASIMLAAFVGGMTISGGSAFMQNSPQPVLQTAASKTVSEARRAQFSAHPPKVDHVSIKTLTGSPSNEGTLLLVRFSKAENVPLQIPINLEEGDVLLRDDGIGGDEFAGDGIHSVLTRMQPGDIEKNLRRIEETMISAHTPMTIPVFEGRVKVAEREFSASGELQRNATTNEIELSAAATGASVDPERSLVIRDLRVVEDTSRTYNPCTGRGTPMGKWTFGYLMREMANPAVTGINPSQFAREWLRKWETDQVVNGFTVAQRTEIKNLIIDPWERASGGPGSQLDLAKAPFKLLAIVNRVDLRENSVYGGGNAGEGRFVFGALDENCQPTQFTVIFEYGIERQGCTAVQNWGRQWYDLSSLPLGSAQYNAALETITEQFVRANAAPGKLNGSALNQLRTNEIALARPWELREFRLLPTTERASLRRTGFLEQTTVALTPDLSHNRTPLLAQFVNENTDAILSGTHVVPDIFNGVRFSGGSSLAPFNGFWDNPAGGPAITNRNARFVFSLNTCNGCHTGETSTIFTHIKPTTFGSPAPLSTFMTGVSVPDPSGQTIPGTNPPQRLTRTFSEFQRRATDLDGLVNSSCAEQLPFQPLPASSH